MHFAYCSEHFWVGVLFVVETKSLEAFFDTRKINFFYRRRILQLLVEICTCYMFCRTLNEWCKFLAIRIISRKSYAIDL